jgi:hypothetical protein
VAARQGLSAVGREEQVAAARVLTGQEAKAELGGHPGQAKRRRWAAGEAAGHRGHGVATRHAGTQARGLPRTLGTGPASHS